MFVVKIQYSGEIRRISFDDQDFLPSFDQLSTHCLALFPIASSFTLSKLFLCPDSSKPSHRILLARGPISCASQYVAAISPFLNARWPNALLRFSVAAQMPTTLPGPASFLDFKDTSTNTQNCARSPPEQDSRWPPLCTTSSSLNQQYPVNTPAPSTISGFPQHINPSLSSFPDNNLSHSMPQHSAPNCAATDPNVEIDQLLSRLKIDISRLLDQSCPSASTEHSFSMQSSVPTIPSKNFVPPSPPPANCLFKCCVGCMKMFQGPWFSCQICHSTMCLSCAEGPAPFCFLKNGPHELKKEYCAACSPEHDLSPVFHQGGNVHFQLPPLDPPVAPPFPITPYWSIPPPPPAPHVLPRFMQYTHPWTPAQTLPPLHSLSLPHKAEDVPSPEASTTEIDRSVSRNGVAFRWGTGATNLASPGVSSTQTGRNSSTPARVSPHEGLPVHDRIRCDSCDETIVGIRHKCLDCPDFDLCTHCISCGGAEAHNPFHEFFEINEPGHVIVHTVFSGDGERDSRPTQSHPPRPVAPPAPPPVAVAAETPVIHFATCDLCDSRIVGERYKCQDCPDFDTCSSCFAIVPEQHPGHAFVRLRNQQDYVVPGAQPTDHAHFATCDSCGKSIHGVRYKCLNEECDDYDLCSKCEALPIPVHPPNHPLLKMKSPTARIPIVVRAGQVVRQNDGSHGDCVLRPVSPGSAASDMYASSQLAHLEQESSPFFRRESPIPGLAYHSDMEPICSGRLFNGNDRPHFTSMFSPPSPCRPPPRTPSPLYRRCSPPCLPPVPVNDFEPLHNYDPARSRSISPNSIVRYPVMLPEPRDNEDDLLSPRPSTPDWRPSGNESIPELPSPPIHPPMLISDAAYPIGDTDDRHFTRRVPMYRDDGNFRSIWEDSPLTHEALLSRPPTMERDELPSTPQNPQLDAPSKSKNPFASAVHNSLSALLIAEPSDHDITAQIPRLPSVPVFNPNTIDQGETKETQDSFHARRVFKLPESRPLGAAFVADILAPEVQIFPPGAEFRKTWKLHNNGTRAWPEDTELIFVAGASMTKPGFTSLPVRVGPVAPGAKTEVTTSDLKAPDSAGRHVSYWRLRDGHGELFGQSFWIDIVIHDLSSSEPSSCETSLSASAVIMPSAPSEQHIPMTIKTPSISSNSSENSEESTTFSDALSDLSSSISLISAPQEEADEWGVINSPDLVAARSIPSGEENQNVEYVILFDDTSSAED